VIRGVLDDTNPEELRGLATRLTEEKSVAVLLGGGVPGGAALVFGCNRSEKGLDVRNAFAAGIAIIEGKGGGNSVLSQGAGPRADLLEDAMDRARLTIIGEIKAL
jgi:alanyl-tRNA synthetase